MRSAGPRNWKRGGAELLEVADLFPNEKLDAIVRVLDPSSLHDIGMLEVRIMNIAAMLNAELYYREKPTSGETKAALALVRTAICESNRALACLDDKTLDVLAEAAEAGP